VPPGWKDGLRGAERRIFPNENPSLETGMNPTPVCCVAERKVVFWLAVASVVITLVTLAWSSERGRLQYEVDYEDIITHIDGLERWRSLSEGSLREFLTEYLEGPPHAPLHSLMAAGAFAMAGPRDWAPYALNGVLVFFFLLLVWKQTQRFGMVPALFALVLAAFVPVVHQSVHQFRPDFPAALATLWAMLVFPKWGDPAFARKAGLSGALFGLALLAKPPFFPYTLAMGFPAWALAVAGAIRASGSVRAAIPAILGTWPFFLFCALIAGPHFLIAWKQIFNYIVLNQFGADAHIWQGATSLTAQLLYHWQGFSGILMLGRVVWILAALAGLGLLFAILARKSQPEASHAYYRLAGFTAWAWAFIAWNPHTNPFFGLTFQYGLVLAGAFTVAWAVHWTRSGDRRRKAFVVFPAAVVLLVAALVFPLLVFKPEFTNADRATTEFVRSLPRRVFDSFQHWRKFSDSGYTLFSCYGEVSSHRMEWLALKSREDFRFFAVPHLPLEKQQELFKQGSGNHRVDFVFAAEADAMGIYTDLPNAQTTGLLTEWIAAREDFALIESIPTPSGSRYHLFMAVPNFSVFEKIDGLSAKTRPLLLEGNPVVMNATSQSIFMLFDSPAAGEATLELAMRCHPVRMDLELFVNGVSIGKIPVEPSHGFPETSLKIPLQQGSNELIFSLLQENGEPLEQPAVQFRRVRITPPGDESPMTDIFRKSSQ
jgi:hypothetical protein